MTPPRIKLDPVPLAYTRLDAAAAISVGPTFFDDHVAPEVRCVRRGDKTLYPVTELQAWLERNAETTLQAAA